MLAESNSPIIAPCKAPTKSTIFEASPVLKMSPLLFASVFRYPSPCNYLPPHIVNLPACRPSWLSWGRGLWREHLDFCYKVDFPLFGTFFPLFSIGFQSSPLPIYLALSHAARVVYLVSLPLSLPPVFASILTPRLGLVAIVGRLASSYYAMQKHLASVPATIGTPDRFQPCSWAYVLIGFAPLRFRFQHVKEPPFSHGPNVGRFQCFNLQGCKSSGSQSRTGGGLPYK